jgi:hypothetical protein
MRGRRVMTVRRYAVVDAEGVKLSSVRIHADALADYYPGYGARLVEEGTVPESPRVDPPVKPQDFALLGVTPDQPMDVGDRIDFETGRVTKPEPEQAVEAVSVDGK